MTATCSRQDDALVFTGLLDRAAAAALWPQAEKAIAGTRRLDLTGVSRVDSAGIALLAAVAALAGDVTVVGEPEGLSELRSAYRLQHNLSFAT